jgi:hypothetical protein
MMSLSLPQLSPTPAHTERTRAVCLRRLDRDRMRSRRLAAVSRFGRHIVAPAIAAVLVMLYAADLVSVTVRTFTASS